MSYASLHWQDDEAQLTTFEVTSRKTGTVLRIEMLVTDPMRLGMMLQDLAAIRHRQALAAKLVKDTERECAAATRAARKAEPQPARVGAQTSPALLTYRGDSK